jgi:hypothetical protein
MCVRERGDLYACSKCVIYKKKEKKTIIIEISSEGVKRAEKLARRRLLSKPKNLVNENYKEKMTMMMMSAGCGWRVVPFVQFNNKYLCLLHIFVFSSSFFTFIFFLWV